MDEGLAKLNEDIARLEAKLEDAKARQKALLARHKTANSRLAARKKIHDYKIDDAMVRFEQYTRRIDDVEGRIEAYDLGLPKDLNHEFASLEAEESVKQGAGRAALEGARRAQAVREQTPNKTTTLEEILDDHRVEMVELKTSTTERCAASTGIARTVGVRCLRRLSPTASISTLAPYE